MGLRPFFTYFGGKWRSAPRYPSPVFDTIIEPFAGAAGYALRHYQRKVILIEKDGRVAALWDYLTNVSPQEILALPDVGDDETVDDFAISVEAKYLIGFWLNKGSTGPRKSPSSWMRARNRPNSFWGQAIRERVASQVEKIVHWRIIHADYRESPDIAATWFIDPPYEQAGRLYRCSSRDIDYCALGQWCISRKGQAMVCENEGACWLPFRSHLVAKSTEGSRGKKTTAESIWTNG